MASSPNKLYQIWQELKRRKVVRVITVYAASAFVVLELLSIIIEPLKLPDWTLQFAIVFLLLGFLVAVILSWIYDIHPGEGIIKTEPAQKNDKEIPRSSNSWKVASYISFVVIVGLILFHIVSRTNRSGTYEDLETSIAVLPFLNISEQESYSNIGNAFTDEIIMKLQKIEDFERVLSFTSTMQYAENRPTIPEIAEKLNVNYLVEGSIQRFEDHIAVNVQIIRAINEDHIWGDKYEERITEPKDILTIQSRIAHSVAEELQVRISPEEKERIEKVPTTSQTAYELYQKAREEINEFFWRRGGTDKIENAIYLARLALEYDPNFALAFAGIGDAYWWRYNRNSLEYPNELDSVLWYADKALSLDNELESGYILRAFYYGAREQNEKSFEALDKVLEINPNYANAYSVKGWRHLLGEHNYPDAIENFQKYVDLNRGPDLPNALRNLGKAYEQSGFPEKFKELLHEAVSAGLDSTLFLRDYALAELRSNNLEQALVYAIKSYEQDSSNFEVYGHLGTIYYMMGRYEESYRYYNRYVLKMEEADHFLPWYLTNVVYVFRLAGEPDRAEHLMNKLIEHFELDLGEGEDVRYLSLAIIHAMNGDREATRENLTAYAQQDLYNLGSAFIRYSPVIEELRDDPEFAPILQEIADKQAAQLENDRRILSDKGLL